MSYGKNESPLPRINRRAFLGRSSAIAVGGAAALSLPHLQSPEHTGALASSTEKTADSVILDMIRIQAEAGPTLEAYVETQARPWLGGPAASGNIYHLREQNVPATSLGDELYFAVYQLSEQLDVDAATSPRPDAGWQRLGLARYSKIADYGRPDPAGDPPDSIMLVVSHPTDVGYDALYNEWYTDNHMIDVARSPHFRSATRYRPVAQSGVPLAYLCIYEIEHPYTPELHRGLMHWLRETPDDFRQEMPTTPAGEGVLTLDIWGYCQRVWSEVAD